MRIVIDLDGTICSLKKEGETYSDVTVLPDALEKLTQLKKDGHYLIIQTARHMKTCGANQGLAIAKIGKITLDWLEKHKIPYDEIFFGKPYADLYIDDMSYVFKGWDEVDVGRFDEDKLEFLDYSAGLRYEELNHYNQVCLLHPDMQRAVIESLFKENESFNGLLIAEQGKANLLGKVDKHGFLIPQKRSSIPEKASRLKLAFYYKRGTDLFSALTGVTEKSQTATLLRAFYRLVSLGKRIKIVETE